MFEKLFISRQNIERDFLSSGRNPSGYWPVVGSRSVSRSRAFDELSACLPDIESERAGSEDHRVAYDS